MRLHPRTQIAWLETAAQAARKIGSRRGEGAHLVNLDSTHRALDGARAVIDCYDQALAISQEIGDRGGESSDVGNLGSAHAARGNARAAIDCYNRALA